MMVLNTKNDEKGGKTMPSVTINDKNIILSGEINEESAGIIISTIIKINQDDDTASQTVINYTPSPICLYINSGGGDLFSGLGIVDVVETSNTPIFTFCVGNCCSAAFLLLLAGHKRFMTEKSYCMYHNLWHGIVGRLGQIMDVVEIDVEVQNKIDAWVMKKTKITKKMMESFRKEKKDFWMDAEKCYKLGIIDSIVK